MKPSEIVAKFKEVLLSSEDVISEVVEQEVELQEDVEGNHYGEPHDMEEKEEKLMDSPSKEEFDKLKSDFSELKGMVEKMMGEKKMEEKKELEVPEELNKEELSADPIVHSPEETVESNPLSLFAQNRQQTTLDRIFNQLSKK